MVIDIKMCRFENVPWGFRLVGGSDFEYPLTVVKVTEGSLAEEAGLRVGDVIVRINDAAASPLTHEEANHIIKHCGNVFYFGIYREHEDPEEVPKYFPINEPQSMHETMPAAENYCKSPVPFEHQLNSDGLYVNISDSEERAQQAEEQLSERADSVMSENTEIKLVEEEIAAVLSGETEVLKEHNVLGIFPKPGVCMTSDVLRTLNEEAIKTKAEKELEKKKWTTFLQKPDRPIPKSKQQLEAERRAANAYKVQIVKSVPRTPERAFSPSIAEGVTLAPVSEDAKEPDFTIKAEETPKPTEPELEEPTPADSEVPNLEEETAVVENKMEIENKSEENVEYYENGNEQMNELVTEQNLSNQADVVNDNLEVEHVQVQEQGQEQQEQSAEIIAEKTAEEIALERQLADVQKQLEALSTLPSTIQATLDAVTKQLAVLLPTFKLQQQQQQPEKSEIKEEVRHVYMEIGSDEEHANCVEVTAEKAQETDENEAVSAEEMKKESQSALSAQTHTNGLSACNEITMNVAREPQTQPAGMEIVNHEEQQMKKQKKHDVIEELEEHLERKSNPRRSKRLFGPLTPSSERPLVLPGGRRWYRPKDAFNDEFIAETLSAQAELITGTTLGVNFMKYQKPEKKIDLNRSEVYKVIHHLDRQPVRGIEVRPPIVPAEADIRKAVQSV